MEKSKLIEMIQHKTFEEKKFTSVCAAFYFNYLNTNDMQIGVSINEMRNNAVLYLYNEDTGLWIPYSKHHFNKGFLNALGESTLMNPYLYFDTAMLDEVYEMIKIMADEIYMEDHYYILDDSGDESMIIFINNEFFNVNKRKFINPYDLSDKFNKEFPFTYKFETDMSHEEVIEFFNENKIYEDDMETISITILHEYIKGYVTFDLEKYIDEYVSANNLRRAFREAAEHCCEDNCSECPCCDDEEENDNE